MKYNGPYLAFNNQDFITDDDTAGGGFKKVEYIYTLDGDTACFLIDGAAVRVRFFGVDTPEYYTEEKELYSVEARTFTDNCLKYAKNIYLQTDPFDSLYDDSYPKRLLAWVWVDYKLLNVMLVEKGYANVNYIFTDKLLYLSDLYKAAEFAKKENLRINKKEA